MRVRLRDHRLGEVSAEAVRLRSLVEGGKPRVGQCRLAVGVDAANGVERRGALLESDEHGRRIGRVR